MRIVYIASSIVPSHSANSIHVMKMCSALASNGHDVSLILPRNRDRVSTSTEDVFSFYGVTDRFTIHRIEWHSIRGASYLYAFEAANKAVNLNADLVYGRQLAACYFAAKFGLSTIFESHAPIRDKGLIHHLVFSRLLKSTNYLYTVVITHALKRYYVEEYKIDPPHILVAPDGADELPTEGSGVPLSDTTTELSVGFTGNLYPGKGIEIVIGLARECTWARFHVVGGTAREIQDWEMQQDIPKNLTFHGFVPHGQVASYLFSFDVLLLPNQKYVSAYTSHPSGRTSNIASWTSPLKLFEYMSVGKPILASDLPVLREILVHGENSLLCDVTDIQSWCNQLERLRNDADLRQRLGSAAQKDFVSYYTWHTRATNVVERRNGDRAK